ncbi:MAG TPA: hypothetical protein VID25_07770 [Candidatus Limnocylindrales bacterium]
MDHRRRRTPVRDPNRTRPPAPRLRTTRARASALPDPPGVLPVVVAGGVTPTLLEASAEPVGVADPVGVEESLGEADPVGVDDSVGVADSVGGAVSVGAAEPLGHGTGLPVTSKQPVSLALGASDADSDGASEDDALALAVSLADSLGHTSPTAQPVGCAGTRGPFAAIVGASDMSSSTPAAAMARRAGRPRVGDGPGPFESIDQGSR